MTTLEKELRAVRLRAEGLTLRAIGRELGLDKDAVARICRERNREVARLHSEFIEEVNAQAAATYADRLRRQGETLRELYRELNKRIGEGNAFDKVPTDRLIELIGKQELMIGAALVTPPEERQADPARVSVRFITDTDNPGKETDTPTTEAT